jgi:hypothetical protein
MPLLCHEINDKLELKLDLHNDHSFGLEMCRWDAVGKNVQGGKRGLFEWSVKNTGSRIQAWYRDNDRGGQAYVVVGRKEVMLRGLIFIP